MSETTRNTDATALADNAASADTATASTAVIDDVPQTNPFAGMASAAGFAGAESAEILNLLGDQESGGSCCGGGCCS